MPVVTSIGYRNSQSPDLGLIGITHRNSIKGRRDKLASCIPTIFRQWEPSSANGTNTTPFLIHLLWEVELTVHKTGGCVNIEYPIAPTVAYCLTSCINACPLCGITQHSSYIFFVIEVPHNITNQVHFLYLFAVNATASAMPMREDEGGSCRILSSRHAWWLGKMLHYSIRLASCRPWSGAPDTRRKRMKGSESNANGHLL